MQFELELASLRLAGEGWDNTAWRSTPGVLRGVRAGVRGRAPTGLRVLAICVASLFLCAVLALHARAEGLEQVERESLAGLERTLATG